MFFVELVPLTVERPLRESTSGAFPVPPLAQSPSLAHWLILREDQDEMLRELRKHPLTHWWKMIAKDQSDQRSAKTSCFALGEKVYRCVGV